MSVAFGSWQIWLVINWVSKKMGIVDRHHFIGKGDPSRGLESKKIARSMSTVIRCEMGLFFYHQKTLRVSQVGYNFDGFPSWENGDFFWVNPPSSKSLLLVFSGTQTQGPPRELKRNLLSFSRLESNLSNERLRLSWLTKNCTPKETTNRNYWWGQQSWLQLGSIESWKGYVYTYIYIYIYINYTSKKFNSSPLKIDLLKRKVVGTNYHFSGETLRTFRGVCRYISTPRKW